MTRKELIDKLSVYIPHGKVEDQPVERLMRLGKAKDRSVNHLVIQAILEYLEQEEARN